MAAPQNLEAVTPILESYLTEFKSRVFSVAISPQGREWVLKVIEVLSGQ
jgi:hypothetical protein